MPCAVPPLPSGLSEEAISALIADLPNRPIPTYDTLPYEAFLNDHLIPNTPFLLSHQSTSSWAARKDWRLVSDPCYHNGSATLRSRVSDSPNPARPPDMPCTHQQCSTPASRPNLTALRQFASHIVPVADTSQREFSEFRRSERPVGLVLDLWEKGEGQGLYVKDWHLMAELEGRGRGVGEVYEVPGCFREDWLNPPYMSDTRPPPSAPHPGSSLTSRALVPEDNQCHADFRFTYLGPSGTFTPLHRDVYASYSWSANVVGRKVWWLFPPDTVPALQGTEGEVGFDVRDIKDAEVLSIRILQMEGEIIFVPSGWYHQVVNLDFCISINHNFISPLTLPRVFTALEEAQAKVEESIADVKDMIRTRHGFNSSASTTTISTTAAKKAQTPSDIVHDWEIEWGEEVQKLLSMDAGWGWAGFWDCIRRNLETPPSDQAHSAPPDLRGRIIRQVVESFKRKREWKVLSDVRKIVQDIERLLER